MAKDDIVLGVEMGKLEIEPVKITKNNKEENPFVPDTPALQKRSFFGKTCQQNVKCSCIIQKKNKNLAICKKKHNKYLKEPVLKLLQVNSQTYTMSQDCLHLCTKKTLPSISSSEGLNLCALVDNCNQLRITPGSNEQIPETPEQNNDNRWWKTEVKTLRPPRETSSVASQPGSCSQQALNPPCDVTIDELASYFETLVHIPKKMSSMAEMMYI